MAKLTKDDVLKLARLAHLELSDDEILQFTDEISSILGYIEQLNQVNLDGLEPTYQVTGLTNVLRKDEVLDYGPTSKDLLRNSPETHQGHIKVKRMLR